MLDWVKRLFAGVETSTSTETIPRSIRLLSRLVADARSRNRLNPVVPFEFDTLIINALVKVPVSYKHLCAENESEVNYIFNMHASQILRKVVKYANMDNPEKAKTVGRYVLKLITDLSIALKERIGFDDGLARNINDALSAVLRIEKKKTA